MLTLPRALSENRRMRRAAFTLLYVSQGIPEGVITIALPAYLAMQGVSAAAIAGFVSITILPWSLKVLKAPIMDRFSFLAMGRRRPWVLLGQLGLVLSFCSLALIGDPVTNLHLLTAGCFAVSLFGSVQDVAVDGMAIDITPIDEQPELNGWMWGGKTIGIALSAALGSWMINAAGLPITVLAMGGAIAGVMMIPLLVRERSGERLLPWSSGAAARETLDLQLDGWSEIGRSLRKVLVLRLSLIVAALAFAYGLYRGFGGTFFPIFAVQGLEWTDTGYSQLMATTGIVAGGIAMLVGGWLVGRIGRRPALVGFVSGLAAFATIGGLFPALWTVPLVVPSFLYAAAIFDTLFVIAFLATAMTVCWRRVSATQFCLYVALINLGAAAGAAAFGRLSLELDYTGLFFVLAGLAAGTALLSLFVTINPHLHQLTRLDAQSDAGADARATLDMTPEDMIPESAKKLFPRRSDID